MKRKIIKILVIFCVFKILFNLAYFIAFGFFGILPRRLFYVQNIKKSFDGKQLCENSCDSTNISKKLFCYQQDNIEICHFLCWSQTFERAQLEHNCK